MGKVCCEGTYADYGDELVWLKNGSFVSLVSVAGRAV